MRSKETEFLDLKQGNMKVVEYAAKFPEHPGRLKNRKGDSGKN